MTERRSLDRLRARIVAEFEDARVQYRLDGVCFVLGLMMTGLLAVLAVRAAVRLEMSYDAPWYHWPFAARWAGLDVPHEPSSFIQRYFEGFPPLPHMAEGILWRLTGSMNATGVVNYLAFVVFLFFCWRALKAPVWLVAMIALTAPLVLIHTTVSHVDLFTNCWLAISLCAFVRIAYFRENENSALFAWLMTGLVGAAWSKLVMALPVAACFAVYFTYFQFARGLNGAVRKRRLYAIAAVALVAALPYGKNLVVYGNPFWPMQVPYTGEMFPYGLKTAEIERDVTPPPLRGASKLKLFVHSLFEIDHPTSYPNRHRWTVVQGKTWLANYMGGFWGPSVAVFLTVLLAMAIAINPRRGLIFAAGAIAVFGFTVLLPASFQLRFYMFIPLCWAAIIAMLFPEFRRRFPKPALAMLLVFAGMFLYVSDISRHYYKIERIGFEEAARAWNAAAWWPYLKTGKSYCAVGMEPIGFLLTGPTLSEYRIIDRKSASLCPPGAAVIRYSPPKPAK